MTFNKNKVVIWTGVIVAGLIVLFAILIALLPFIARVSFENWAEDQGLSGSITKAEISLTDGQLRLSDVKLLDAYNKGLHVGEVFIQVHMRDLWHKRITIEDLQINTFSVDASRNEAGELTSARAGGRGFFSFFFSSGLQMRSLAHSCIAAPGFHEAGILERPWFLGGIVVLKNICW